MREIKKYNIQDNKNIINKIIYLKMWCTSYTFFYLLSYFVDMSFIIYNDSWWRKCHDLENYKKIVW